MSMFGEAPTNDLVYVMNVHIHEDAKLSRKNFLDRVRCVRAIRANWVRAGITWYPTSSREWNLLAHLHTAVRSGDFGYVGSRDDYKYFGVFLPSPQYWWLANNDPGVLQRQVIGFLAGMYVREPEAEKFMREQLYGAVFKEVRDVALKYFNPKVRQLEHDEFKEYYVAQCKEYTGAPPPLFLRYPECYLNESVASAWGCDLEFHLGYGEFYMSATDWKTIVKEGKYDELLRTESEEGLWQRWKHTFELADSGGGHVFEVFANSSTKGFVYVIRQSDSDLYKIGWTENADVTRRLTSLQTASSEELVLVGSFSASSRQTEAALHRLFAQQRQRGEWFRLTAAQIKNVLDEEWRTQQQIF